MMKQLWPASLHTNESNFSPNPLRNVVRWDYYTYVGEILQSYYIITDYICKVLWYLKMLSHIYFT